MKKFLNLFRYKAPHNRDMSNIYATNNKSSLAYKQRRRGEEERKKNRKHDMGKKATGWKQQNFTLECVLFAI